MGHSPRSPSRSAAMALVTGAVAIGLSLVPSGRAAETDPSADAAWLRGLVTRDDPAAPLIPAIRDESLEQSIANLGWLRLYRNPLFAYPDGFTALMVDGNDAAASRALDQAAVETILRNRRFLKVHAQFSALPLSEAGVLLVRSLRAALADYTPRYQEHMEKFARVCRDWARNNNGLPLGPGGAMSDPPDLAVPGTVEGLRYRVLGLVLIAGNLGADDSKPVFDDVLALALSQRRYLREATEIWPPTRRFELGNKTCYNRIVLATGLSAACGDPGEFRAVCKALGIEEVSRALPAYDGEVPTGPLCTYQGCPNEQPGDPTEGGMSLRLYHVTSDEQLEALLRALGYADHEANTESEPPAGASGVPAVQP